MPPAPILPTERELELWGARAREHEGRDQLLSDGTIASAARALEPAADAWRASSSSSSAPEGQDDDDRPEARLLLLLLRLLRNACAGGAPAARVLLPPPPEANHDSDSAAGPTTPDFARVALELAGELASRYAVAYQRARTARDQQEEKQEQPPPSSADPPPPPPPPPPLLLAAVQLVANLSVAAAAAAGAGDDAEDPCPGEDESEKGGPADRLWPELLPARLRQLTAVPEARVHAPATLAALQLARSRPGAARALCGLASGVNGGPSPSPAAASACWRQLLGAALGGEHHEDDDGSPPPADGTRPPPPPPRAVNDCLPLLVRAVALRRGLLAPLLRCVDEKSEEGSRWGACHVALLHLLAHEAEAVRQHEERREEDGARGAEAPCSSSTRPGAVAAVEALIDVLESAAADVAAQMALDDDVPSAAAATADDEAAPQPPLGTTTVVAPPPPTPAVRVLEAALHALKAVAAREDRGAGLLALSSECGRMLRNGDLLAYPCSSSSAADAADAEPSSSSAAAATITLGARLSQALVAILVALGPPVHPRRPPGAAAASGEEGQDNNNADTDAQKQQQQQQQRRPPRNAAESRVLALSERFPPAATRRMAAEADATVARALRRAAAAIPAARAAAAAAASGRPLPASAPPPPPRPALPGPYQGYRADACACLANALHSRPHLARELLEAGGMDPLLQSCALDGSSPLAREWALWGVRNSCEASAEARLHVASLEASGVVSSPELARAGLAVELDRRTGKARVVKTSERQGEGQGEGR